MEKVFSYIKNFGYFGSIAIVILLYYAGASIPPSNPAATTKEQLLPLLVLAAIMLLAYQFEQNQRNCKKELEHQEILNNSRIAQESLTGLTRYKSMVGDADEAFWNSVNNYLADRRALMDHDEAHYISAVLESSFTLRGNLNEALQKNHNISNAMENYAHRIILSTQRFQQTVENIEKRAGKNFRGASLDRWELDKLCQSAGNNDANCSRDFETAHTTWRSEVQTIVRETSEVVNKASPDFAYLARQS